MGKVSEEIEKLEEKVEALEEENSELKEQLEAVNKDECTPVSSSPFQIGKKYYIRTVTYHMTGKVKKIKGGFLVLTDAAWIADSGRFNVAIETGSLDEVEPVEVDMYVNISSITDAFDWKHKLPREVK